MDLYQVKARGLPYPLNSREIGHLFHIGYLQAHTPCKPRLEGRWQTIDALFPLLKFGPRNYLLPTEVAKKRDFGSRRVRLDLIAILCLAAVAFHTFRSPSAPPTKPRLIKTGSQQEVPVSVAVVNTDRSSTEIGVR